MAQIVLDEEKEFIGDIFGWWYRAGLRDFLIYLKAVFLKISDVFSVKLLLKTFFAPWKRDVISLQGLPLNVMLRVIMMNLVSRFIGAIIKTFVLIVYLIILAGFILVSLTLLATWIFLPIITVLGILLGIYIILRQ
jgi:hypothetical protein